MNVEKLTLKNFRNYEEEEFVFSERINILTGSNAQGKTNCAEAIFLLCTGYSPRANRDKLLIRHNQDGAQIKCEANSRYGKICVRIDFDKSEKKNIFINQPSKINIFTII